MGSYCFSIDFEGHVEDEVVADCLRDLHAMLDGIKFLGWYNVAHGWDFDNVILLELPDYATLDKLEHDEGTRALGHRAGEWIFERHHSMFLRERMGTDLEYHP